MIKINKAKFINWMLADTDDLKAYTTSMKYDLINGNEFILTADELLDITGYVPGDFAIPAQPNVDLVPEECELILVKRHDRISDI